MAQIGSEPGAAKNGWRPLEAGGGIGMRLLAFIVLFSSTVTLILTAAMLYLDYRRDVRDIEARLDEIERGYLASLGAGLWHLDVDQIRLQLEGILRLPDMTMAEVRETAPDVAKHLVVTAGHPQTRAAITRERPIAFTMRGETRTLGTLTLQATLDGVYQRIMDRTMSILLTQGIKTFLVSAFILFVVWRVVTRHLYAIAAFLARYDFHDTPPTLRLERRPPAAPDELDRMVLAFNTMAAGLQQAYRELTDMNAALEQDIAARRRAEEEVSRLNAVLEQRVRQRTAELEAANEELGAFTYSVSHDLRAPLRRIEGFGRILLEEYADRVDQRGQHYLERIRAGVKEMADMIDSFLKLSRSTRGALAVERVDLSALAREAIDRLREREPDREVDVTIEPDVTAEGDRRILAAAMQNLLDNAWKYSRHASQPAIAFGTRREGDTVVHFVRDNGVGFDMAHAGRLFTPFTRLHRADEFEGAGIGLATVQRIVARHGGRVWAEAEPGRGATILFTLWEERGRDGRPQEPDHPAG